jgi:hypothetical protein
MKTLVFLLSLWLMAPDQTDIYYVVKVSGDITNPVSGLAINRGDEILAMDELVFGGKDAYALVVGEKGERLKIAYPNKDANQEGEFRSLVKNSVAKTGRVRIKTRSIITNADIKDLKEFLGEDEFTVIGNSLNVQLSKQTFSENTVLAKFDKNGEIINKELIGQDLKLDISRKTLGVKQSGEVKLYHVDFFQKNEQEGIKKITRLNVNFIDEFAIRDEMATIIGVYKKKGFDKINMKSYLMEYFLDFYGNTHMYTLSGFVDKIIAETMK